MFNNITLLSIIGLFLIIGIFFYIYKISKKNNYTKTIIIALVLAIIFGSILNFLFYSNMANEVWLIVDKEKTKKDVASWLSLFGYGFVDLLRMIVIPLVFVSILTAIIKISSDNTKFGKTLATIIAVLMVTVSIGGLVGIFSANLFKLNANNILNTKCDLVMDKKGNPKDINGINWDKEAYKQCHYGFNRGSKKNEIKDIPSTIRSFIPAYPIYALTGKANNSTIKVVIFAGFIGLALLALKNKFTKEAEILESLIFAMQKLVMQIVKMVLTLTPYGMFAILTRQLLTNDLVVLYQLGNFIVASYVSLFIMFIIHLFIVSFFGFNPKIFVQKIWSTLVFAFISRSSAGTLPLTIETQRNRLGVSDGIASASSSFGTTIGQNACAGIYPAMLAVMIASSMGLNTLSPIWIITVIVIVMLGSFGIAGVGGGATFAAIVTISALGYDLTLIGVLVAIEAFIDMGRTAVNVSGSIVSGLVTGKLTNSVDMKIYNSNNM